MVESGFQAQVIQELSLLFPGCFITKQVPPPQGIPDLLIEYGKTWARLETKKSLSEPYRPNQEYYIALFNEMSFAAMVCPENKQEVYRQLKIHFTLFSGLFLEL